MDYYYSTIVYWDYIRIMEQKMETTIVYRGYIGIILGLYWGYIGVFRKSSRTASFGGCASASVAAAEMTEH